MHRPYPQHARLCCVLFGQAQDECGADGMQFGTIEGQRWVASGSPCPFHYGLPTLSSRRVHSRLQCLLISARAHRHARRVLVLGKQKQFFEASRCWGIIIVIPTPLTPVRLLACAVACCTVWRTTDSTSTLDVAR